MNKSLFRGSIFGVILPILYGFFPLYFRKFPYKEVMPTFFPAVVAKWKMVWYNKCDFTADGEGSVPLSIL